MPSVAIAKVGAQSKEPALSAACPELCRMGRRDKSEQPYRNFEFCERSGGIGQLSVIILVFNLELFLMSRT